MRNWTDETDREAAEFYPTLSEAEIRRRQTLTSQQLALNYQRYEHEGRTLSVEDAAHDLRRQEDALMREMLRRCGAVVVDD